MMQHFNCRCEVSTLESIQAITPEQVKSHVLGLLNWNEEDFGNFFLDAGMNYLKAYFQEDQEGIRIIQAKASFWAWFKNHWTYRDLAFIEAFIGDDLFDYSFKLASYSNLHNPAVLACEIFPPKTVLGKDFSIISIQMSC